MELNGNDIYYEDDSNAYALSHGGKSSNVDETDKTLFLVDDSADLTIQDSVGGGKIHSSAYFIGYRKCTIGLFA